MSEGEVVEQLVNFTEILLAGVSVLFTVVSAYIAALNYFIGAANFAARFLSFAFVSLIIGMLMFVMLGAQATQVGLVQRLHELDADGKLTAAGKAILANATPDARLGAMFGGPISIDDVVRLTSWTGIGLIFAVLFYLTFFHRWTAEVIPVQLQDASKKVVS
jgi:hypothetical protein